MSKPNKYWMLCTILAIAGMLSAYYIATDGWNWTRAVSLTMIVVTGLAFWSSGKEKPRVHK